jgi:PhnB protein
MTLPIGGNSVLMGSDTSGEWNQEVKQGNNFSISINTATIVKADRLFDIISEGGKVTMPMDNTFWGSYFGMFTDKFGINWMVNVDISDES